MGNQSSTLSHFLCLQRYLLKKSKNVKFGCSLWQTDFLVPWNFNIFWWKKNCVRASLIANQIYYNFVYSNKSLYLSFCLFVLLSGGERQWLDTDRKDQLSICLSVSLIECLSVCVSVFLTCASAAVFVFFLSLSLSLSLAHTHTLFLSLSRTHTLFLSLSRPSI